MIKYVLVDPIGKMVFAQMYQSAKQAQENLFGYGLYNTYVATVEEVNEVPFFYKGKHIKEDF